MKCFINVRSSDYILEAWPLMISALDSKSTGPDSSDGRSHCSVFLGDFHMGGYSHRGDSYRGELLRYRSIPSRREVV